MGGRRHSSGRPYTLDPTPPSNRRRLPSFFGFLEVGLGSIRKEGNRTVESERVELKKGENGVPYSN